MNDYLFRDAVLIVLFSGQIMLFRKLLIEEAADGNIWLARFFAVMILLAFSGLVGALIVAALDVMRAGGLAVLR